MSRKSYKNASHIHIETGSHGVRAIDTRNGNTIPLSSNPDDLFIFYMATKRFDKVTEKKLFTIAERLEMIEVEKRLKEFAA